MLLQCTYLKPGFNLKRFNGFVLARTGNETAVLDLDHQELAADFDKFWILQDEFIDRTIF